ncbi:hypothetical protein CFP56_012850 [Quercus suber]|uniref:Uncharacterized protein n=1 Tax=Quercus suber TaxID=58331 RepID=A0AAW0KX95_QUESU
MVSHSGCFQPPTPEAFSPLPTPCVARRSLMGSEIWVFLFREETGLMGLGFGVMCDATGFRLHTEPQAEQDIMHSIPEELRIHDPSQTNPDPDLPGRAPLKP